ncbi:hypothetical protein E1189_15550 [Sansalvadorimonas verongulae]|nr:hypothetical protein [Sansalvadorimonas verongulae]
MAASIFEAQDKEHMLSPQTILEGHELYIARGKIGNFPFLVESGKYTEDLRQMSCRGLLSEKTFPSCGVVAAFNRKVKCSGDHYVCLNCEESVKKGKPSVQCLHEEHGELHSGPVSLTSSDKSHGYAKKASEIRVRCINRVHGCQFEGALNTYIGGGQTQSERAKAPTALLPHLDQCTFVSLACAICKQRGKRTEMTSADEALKHVAEHQTSLISTGLDAGDAIPVMLAPLHGATFSTEKGAKNFLKDEVRHRLEFYGQYAPGFIKQYQDKAILACHHSHLSANALKTDADRACLHLLELSYRFITELEQIRGQHIEKSHSDAKSEQLVSALQEMKASMEATQSEYRRLLENQLSMANQLHRHELTIASLKNNARHITLVTSVSALKKHVSHFDKDGEFELFLNPFRANQGIKAWSAQSKDISGNALTICQNSIPSGGDKYDRLQAYIIKDGKLYAFKDFSSIFIGSPSLILCDRDHLPKYTGPDEDQLEIHLIASPADASPVTIPGEIVVKSGYIEHWQGDEKRWR